MSHASSTHEHENEQSFAENKAMATQIENANAGGQAIADDSHTATAAYWLSPRFIGSMTAVLLLAVCTFVSYSIPVSLLTVINADIGPSADISLVTLVHTLIKGVMFLVIGRISDIFGRRWFIICGQFICSIGSIICALATNVPMLIGGTVLVALGGACQPLYPLLCQEIVPNKYRGMVQGLITMAVLPFIGFGPAVGRSLVQNTELGWRWTYWINLIFCVVSIVLFSLCYHPPNFENIHGNKSKLRQLMEIDWIGLFLYIGGLVPLLLAFVWSTQSTGWGAVKVIAPITIGGVVLIIFVLWETFRELSAPVLPLYLLKSRRFVSAAIVGIVGQMAYYAFNYFWPQQIVYLYTTANIEVGLMASTTGSALAAGEIIFGLLFHFIGKARWQLILSSAGLTLFCGLMALANQDRKGWAIACTTLAGVCIGWVEVIAITVVGLVTPPEDIGVGQGFFSSCRNVGGTIATSIFVAIYGNRLPHNLLKVPAAAIAAGLPETSIPNLMASLASPAALPKVPGMNATILAAVTVARKKAYSSSFAIVYLSSIAFGGLALIAAFFTSNVDSFMTNFVNKRVDNTRKHHDEPGLEMETGVKA